MSHETVIESAVLGDCLQVGVVVKDLDRAMAVLSEALGIGPFRTLDWPPADRPDLERCYHGKPGSFTARMAFAHLGSVELEIIQPLQGDRIWADFLRERGEGIHHLKFNVAELKPFVERLAEHGIGVSQNGAGLRPGTQWAYADVERQVGFSIELMNAVSGTGGRTPTIVNGKLEL